MNLLSNNNNNNNNNNGNDISLNAFFSLFYQQRLQFCFIVVAVVTGVFCYRVLLFCWCGARHRVLGVTYTTTGRTPVDAEGLLIVKHNRCSSGSAPHQEDEDAAPRTLDSHETQKEGDEPPSPNKKQKSKKQQGRKQKKKKSVFASSWPSSSSTTATTSSITADSSSDSCFADSASSSFCSSDTTSTTASSSSSSSSTSSSSSSASTCSSSPLHEKQVQEDTCMPAAPLPAAATTTSSYTTNNNNNVNVHEDHFPCVPVEDKETEGENDHHHHHEGDDDDSSNASEEEEGEDIASYTIREVLAQRRCSEASTAAVTAAAIAQQQQQQQQKEKNKRHRKKKHSSNHKKANGETKKQKKPRRHRHRNRASSSSESDNSREGEDQRDSKQDTVGSNYHTLKGGVLTHFQDATTRIFTDPFYAKHANRRTSGAATAAAAAAAVAHHFQKKKMLEKQQQQQQTQQKEGSEEAEGAPHNNNNNNNNNLTELPQEEAILAQQLYQQLHSDAQQQQQCLIYPPHESQSTNNNNNNNMHHHKQVLTGSGTNNLTTTLSSDSAGAAAAATAPPTAASVSLSAQLQTQQQRVHGDLSDGGGGLADDTETYQRMLAAATTSGPLPLPQNPIYRIVITGGPCSGKSTSMAYLKKDLESYGFAVYCVPEVATLLMTGGAKLWLTHEEQVAEEQKVKQHRRLQHIVEEYQKALREVAAEERERKEEAAQRRRHRRRQEGEEKRTKRQKSAKRTGRKSTNRRETARPDHEVVEEEGEEGEEVFISPMKLTMQRVVLQLMLFLEDCFYELASMLDKPSVILYDRGTMDGSAYCSPKEWDQILKALHYSEEEVRDVRYDAVIHFVTAALGAESFYTLENNAARHETKEEAALQDMQTRNAWRGHFLFYIIDNSTGFERKLQRAAHFIHRVVGLTPTNPAALYPHPTSHKPLPTTGSMPDLSTCSLSREGMGSPSGFCGDSATNNNNNNNYLAEFNALSGPLNSNNNNNNNSYSYSNTYPNAYNHSMGSGNGTVSNTSMSHLFGLAPEGGGEGDFRADMQELAYIMTGSRALGMRAIAATPVSSREPSAERTHRAPPSHLYHLDAHQQGNRAAPTHESETLSTEASSSIALPLPLAPQQQRQHTSTTAITTTTTSTATSNNNNNNNASLQSGAGAGGLEAAGRQASTSISRSSSVRDVSILRDVHATVVGSVVAPVRREKGVVESPASPTAPAPPQEEEDPTKRTTPSPSPDPVSDFASLLQKVCEMNAAAEEGDEEAAADTPQEQPQRQKQKDDEDEDETSEAHTVNDYHALFNNSNLHSPNRDADTDLYPAITTVDDLTKNNNNDNNNNNNNNNNNCPPPSPPPQQPLPASRRVSGSHPHSRDNQTTVDTDNSDGLPEGSATGRTAAPPPLERERHSLVSGGCCGGGGNDSNTSYLLSSPNSATRRGVDDAAAMLSSNNNNNNNSNHNIGGKLVQQRERLTMKRGTGEGVLALPPRSGSSSRNSEDVEDKDVAGGAAAALFDAALRSDRRETLPPGPAFPMKTPTEEVLDLPRLAPLARDTPGNSNDALPPPMTTTTTTTTTTVCTSRKHEGEAETSVEDAATEPANSLLTPNHTLSITNEPASASVSATQEAATTTTTTTTTHKKNAKEEEGPLTPQANPTIKRSAGLVFDLPHYSNAAAATPTATTATTTATNTATTSSNNVVAAATTSEPLNNNNNNNRNKNKVDQLNIHSISNPNNNNNNNNNGVDRHVRCSDGESAAELAAFTSDDVANSSPVGGSKFSSSSISGSSNHPPHHSHHHHHPHVVNKYNKDIHSHSSSTTTTTTTTRTNTNTHEQGPHPSHHHSHDSSSSQNRPLVDVVPSDQLGATNMSALSDDPHASRNPQWTPSPPNYITIDASRYLNPAVVAEAAAAGNSLAKHPYSSFYHGSVSNASGSPMATAGRLAAASTSTLLRVPIMSPPLQNNPSQHQNDNLNANQPSTMPSPTTSQANSTSAATTADDFGLQRHFILKSYDKTKVPADAVTADVTMLFLIPTRPEYFSEVLIRRAKVQPTSENEEHHLQETHSSSSSGGGGKHHHHQHGRRDKSKTRSVTPEAPGTAVYLRRIEYLQPLFRNHTGDHPGASSTSLSMELQQSNNNTGMTARNTSTRQISRSTFLHLAQHFDPSQPFIRKRTQRFLYLNNQLTLVTFLMPAELRGVSRVVGPASLTLSELPPWMDVDEAVSLMGADSVM